MKLTYGLEVEACRLKPFWVDYAVTYGFDKKFDRTIRSLNDENLDPNNSGELSTPVYEAFVNARLQVNTSATEEKVRKLCECLDRVNKTCGVHVHLGNPTDTGESKWTDEQVKTWAVLGLMMEKRVLGLVPPSRRDNATCLLIAKAYDHSDFNKPDIIGELRPRKYDNLKRYCWLNLTETKRVGTRRNRGYAASPALNTVEVRLLGNTRRYDYIMAWTKLWIACAGLVAQKSSSEAVLAYMSGALDSYFDTVKEAKTAPANRNTRTGEPRFIERGKDYLFTTL